MPYIKKEDRKEIDPNALAIANLSKKFIVHDLTSPFKDEKEGRFRPHKRIDPGKLNYIITKLILDSGFDPSYSEYNAVVGALECCKLEFYRRAITDYEEGKILTNGDVYPTKP